MRTILTADRLLIPGHNGGEILDHPLVTIEDGRIASISSRSEAELPPGVQPIHYPGATLAPSFLDIHTHGNAGHDVMEATPEALGIIGRFLAAHGTGSYLATTVTAPVDETLNSLAGIAKHIAAEPTSSEARLIGIHLEGPFLSHIRKGAHPPEHLLPPDIALFDRMLEAAEGHVRLITLAPELPGAIDLARHAVAHGVRVSIGHSNATSDEARAGIVAGATSATHTFNAMRPFDHRAPGIIGTVLSTDSLFAELICDGVHTAPESALIWWRSKGPRRAILITDAMSAAGMPDGMYRLGSNMVEVKNGIASTGDALAGSLLTLDSGIKNCMEFTGASLEEALGAATTNPAAMLGLPSPAERLAEGQPANFVALSPQGKFIASIINGNPVPAFAR
jgi:N-acetylglucosamine-6-phosphate deacetylase